MPLVLQIQELLISTTTGMEEPREETARAKTAVLSGMCTYMYVYIIHQLTIIGGKDEKDSGDIEYRLISSKKD